MGFEFDTRLGRAFLRVPDTRDGKPGPLTSLHVARVAWAASTLSLAEMRTKGRRCWCRPHRKPPQWRLLLLLLLVVVALSRCLSLALAGSRSRLRNAGPSPFQLPPLARNLAHRGPSLSEARASTGKYGALVATLNPPLTFVAIALSDFGGIGFKFYTTVVKPPFDGMARETRP
jgi:hypothetical protein